MKAKAIIVIVSLFYSILSFSQLNDFTISTVVTNEMCQNNGAIFTSIQNGTVGASTVYKIYKLPNITLPISGLQNATSLSFGDYKVIVSQTLGNSTLTKETTVTILNQIINLSFSLGQNAISSCEVNGSIVVTILTGTASVYELFQGNQLLVSQSTNEFANLTAGLYKVRVIDNCGYGVPQDFNLILTPSNLNVSLASYPLIANSCNNIEVLNNISPTPGTNLVYPITVVYTIHPPNNAPNIISTQTYSSGLPELLVLSKIFPVGNESYTFDLSVTDNCQKNALSLANSIDPNPKVILSDNLSKCGRLLTVSVSNFSPDYSITFLNSPSGFSPNSLNPLQLGPFSSPSTDYGDATHQVPFGSYQVEIVDGCGRIAISALYEVLDIPLIPIKVASNSGCNSTSGNITVSLPDNRKIVFAQVITTAPSEFLLQNVLPYNATGFINNLGKLKLINIPGGLYHIEFTDECGISYAVDVLVPPFINKPFVAAVLPNCDSGSGSVKISTKNGPVTNVTIISAPPAFLLQHNLPFDVTSNISAGVFYMNNLNEGIYDFKCKDLCGYEATISKQIDGYNRAQSGKGFVYTRNCGSYDISVSDTSNATFLQKFWLQKQNPVTLTWQHPTTGVTYNEATNPDITNSISLENNVTLFNLTQIGIFRLIKTFQTFNDGSLGGSTKICKEILGEFEFTNGLKIQSIYSLNCTGVVSSAVTINADGVPPYHFSIISKDNLPFNMDNGSNNIFPNLPPGNYEFFVKDFCTATKTVFCTVGNLPQLAKAFTPQDLKICKEDNSQADIFDLTSQNAAILGQQDVNSYSIHYYLTQDNANNDVNRINNESSFLTTQNPQTIFARVNHKILLPCYDTSSFKIYIGKIPVLNPSLPVFICDDFTKKIYADVNNLYDSYEWSTGEKTFGITVNQPGVYTVIAKNVYGAMSCESLPKSITVTKSGKPVFDKFETVDWTVDNNSIAVFVLSGFGSYSYSLDGINYQTDNTFSDLQPDFYKVFIKDDNGCGEIDKEVVLMNYVKFFTPNGDGVNDEWLIKFSKLEPNLNVQIFDRYGKFVAVLGANNNGWDGTYNGEPLPSSDYWFIVNRQDGKVYKGHFALKR